MSANRFLAEDNDKGEVWVRKTILQLWEFARDMWEHRNAVLTDTEKGLLLKKLNEEIEQEKALGLERFPKDMKHYLTIYWKQRKWRNKHGF